MEERAWSHIASLAVTSVKEKERRFGYHRPAQVGVVSGVRSKKQEEGGRVEGEGGWQGLIL